MNCLHKNHINPLIFKNLNGKNWKIKDYIKRGGYKSIKKIIKNKIKAEKIIKLIKTSNLKGRGGAGFPTGIKWEFLFKNNSKKKYIICNSDEGEPGTFKDRDILLYNPHSIIEGMIIAAYTMNIKIGYNYIHGEIHEAYKRFEYAIKEAYFNKLLGKKILNSNLNFNLFAIKGHGSYICGEETALIESIEGKKALPRFKPPFPANKGLWGKPTIINNTETLASIPFIIKLGSKNYLSIGTQKSGGTKIFSISGDIKNPGNYEVPLGIKFSKLIKLSGGILNNKKLKAVIPGGSSTPIVKAKDIINIKMDYDNLLNINSMLGSGGIIIINETRCIVKILLNISYFYFKESCGKCTPCREGTGWMYKLIKKIEYGKGEFKDLLLLKEIANNIKGKTICAFGDATSMPIISFIKNFYNEFKFHIKHKTCLIK